MKILHVIGWLAPRYGGPAIWVPQLAAAVAELGHHVEIVTTNADGPGVLDVPTRRAGEWAMAKVTFHPLCPPRSYLTSPSLFADLYRRAAGFDVFHIHSPYRFHTVAAAAVARRYRIPYVIQVHGALDPWHRSQRRRAKDIYHFFVEDPIIRTASAILCTTRQEETAIRDLGYTGPTWVLPAAIDADVLREPAALGTLDDWGIEPDAPIITYLGRISEKKGVPLLVEAFAQTAQSIPRAHLVVAGPDDEGIGRGLLPLITNAGLAGRVSLVGAVTGNRKNALLQRSAVLVLPSVAESFGSTVVEAMAVGCPVVISPHVAIQDVVQSSGAGLVARRDPADIARAVGAVLANPEAAAAMGEAGRKVVDEKFSWPSVAGDFEAMYEAVMVSGRKAAE